MGQNESIETGAAPIGVTTQSVTQLMPKIYVLKLEDGKYYIGRSNDINRRFQEHLQGGSAWTTKYRPLEIVRTEDSTSLFDEDKFVLEYMAIYGVENVRGGSYSNIELTHDQKTYIENITRSANDRCYKCGNIGHFAKNCSVSQHCTRCGRNNHNIDNCYATTHLNGTTLPIAIATVKPDTKYESVSDLTKTPDLKIFEALKLWRLKKSKDLVLKPYQVFTDATLKDIAFYKPKNRDELNCIKGVGPKKTEEYASDIIKIINY